MNEAEYLMSILGCYPPRPSEISIILRMIQKPNSIIVLLFIENNFQFKNIAKTCLPPSTFRVVQLRKYSPDSRCHPSSCLLAVLAMFLSIISPSSYSWNEWNFRHFFSTTKTTQPRPQVFSVNGALTRKNAAFLTSFPRQTQNSSKFGHQ